MPRYFFDIHDGVDLYDLEGTMCRDVDHVRSETKKLLPAIALERLARAGEHKAYTVQVRDEEGETVYRASLEFRGGLKGSQ